jgi:hypothetical protein
MSEIPPIQDPGRDVPPVFAQYPRGSGAPPHGTPEKLEALMEGYYGLNWAFLAYVGLAIVAIIVLAVSEGDPTGLVLFFVLLAGSFALMGFLAHRCNKKIGYGLNWKESTPMWVTLGLVFGSCLFSPVIVFIIIQLIAMAEIKNYGVKSSFLGVRKKDIVAKIAEMRSMPGLRP